jgi:sporulation protein YlmC with PRC-barrel domain
MIRASGLYGRTVIDLDTAERIGDIDEIIVDPHGPGIAGYVVICERSLFSSKKRIIIPIEAFHAIGPDALTMRSTGPREHHTAHLDALPRLSELTGRRMVSFGGRLLGSVEDALISERDGRIIGYPLDRPGAGTWLDSVFGLGWKSDQPDYVRADAGLRIGARLIVVPDDAIASGADLQNEPEIDALRYASLPEIPSPPLQPTRSDASQHPTDDEIRASQSHTTPFARGERAITDEGLGLRPSAESDPDQPFERPALDPEQDAAPIAASISQQSRTRRRPQAERQR